MSLGYGALPWGGGPWGGDDDAALEIVGVLGISENVVRVTFSQPVYFSGLGEPYDAAVTSLWSVVVVAGTSGYDGTDARAVGVARVEQPVLPGAVLGTAIDLVLDRHMTPYPAEYKLLVSPLISTADLSETVTIPESPPVLHGCYRKLVVVDAAAVQPFGDLADPQTQEGANASGLPNPSDPSVLGTIPTDGSGDYAMTVGLPSFKERMFRRIFARPGAFLHLGRGYGLGAGDYVKKLALAATKAQLAAGAEQQIAQEPEVEKCKVTGVMSLPGLYRLSIAVKLKSGETQGFDLDIPAG